MRSIECSSQGWPKFPNLASGRISPMSPYVFRSMKWRQNHFDVITISNNLVKEESKETMALEVVTGGKNDKTEKNN